MSVDEQGQTTEITAYRVTITRAPSIHEQGTGLSLTPWAHDTGAYKGYDEEVTVRLHHGAKIEDNNWGKLIFAPGETLGMTLPEAIYRGFAKVVK